MGKPTDTIVRAELAEAALKLAIRSTLRSSTEARPEDLVLTEEAQRALFDALLNPPCIDPTQSSTKPAKVPKSVGNAALNRLLQQASAKLETPRKRTRRKR